jgi:hypothetical protein
VTGALRTFSFGGGVQTTAALVLAARGELDFRTSCSPASARTPSGRPPAPPSWSPALGRIGVGVDLPEPYCRLARWRVFDSGHAAKALARTWAGHQTTLAHHVVTDR